MNSTTSEGPTVTTATTPTSSSAAADNILSNNKPTTTLATAVAVDDRTVVVADPVVSAMDNNKKDQKQKRKKQTTNVIVTVVGLLVLMTVVVLSVLLTQKGGTNNNKNDETGISSTNNGSSSSSSSLDDSTNNNNNITPQDENSGSLFLGDDSGSTETLELLYQQRTKDMISILESLYEDSEGGIQVFDVSSPFASEDRIAALEWIVKEDPSKIAIPTIATTTQQTTTDEQQGQIYKVRQRYVLALFYMATNGQDWDKQYNFLAAGIDECQWTSIHNAEGMETVINPDDGYNGNVKGAICNDKGQLEKIVMYWNGMSGTLPHELSLFSETLKELNIAGGSISGQIPSSITKLKRLESLSLSDNCLTGELPQEMNHIDMPNLSVLGVQMNNYGLTAFSGNMGSFCDGNGTLVDGVVGLAIDCPPEQFTTTTTTTSNSTLADVSPWGCDCCICCNPDKFQCQNMVSKFQVHFLDELSSNGYPKGFDTQCVSSEQESWIAENCPCLINVTTEPTVQPFRGSCTTDCSQEGAIPSYDFGS